MDLVYRAGRINDLALGECTIRGAHDAQARTWWQLWMWVRRDDTGEPFYVAVPVHRAPYTEVGPSGRRTWSIAQAGEGTWQVAPSIDVVGDERPDGTRKPSLWHQTSRIVGVPASEPWV